MSTHAMTTGGQAVGPGVGDANSLEPILFSEVYPKKPMQCDEDGLRAPFMPLYGESIEYLGRTSDGVIALSNYRVFVMLKESFINIPIGVVESVEYRDIFFMHVFCKDARTFRCAFSTNDSCLEWCKRLMQSIRPPARLIDTFAFSFHAWLFEAERLNQVVDGFSCLMKDETEEPHGSVFDREVQRLGFDLKTAWRITHANNDFKVCSSYPRQHIVPNCVTDKDIDSVADFRSSRRFPSVTWRDPHSGVVLARSSQPTVGWLGWRNTQDEAMLKAIADSCSVNTGPEPKGIVELSNAESAVSITNDGIGSVVNNGVAVANGGSANGSVKLVNDVSKNKLVIVDARSYTAAVANRAKGGGCECQEYYTNCEIMFMSLANIHTIRKSFLALRAICAMSPDQPGWLINLENTKWLQYISGLLKSAIIVVNTIDKDRKPVLVHCSDGWDRTPQIVALAELMLDPYYRTIEGFRTLVEKEWTEFGHKFADRCGQGVAVDDVNERCPVFLQWLDCVHQLVRQFPCSFQFNETYLVKLVQHVYSCLFGDFLCNAEIERARERVRQKTSSVWLLLSRHNSKFVNLLYRPLSDRVLRPLCHIQSLHFWNAVYLSDTATAAHFDGRIPAASAITTDELNDAAGSEASSSSVVTSPDQQVAIPSKTRSCDDLTKAGLEDDDRHPMSSAQRRLSDSNLAAHAAVAATSDYDDKLPASVVVQATPIESAKVDGVLHDEVTLVLKINAEESPHECIARKCASSETLKALEDDVFDSPHSVPCVFAESLCKVTHQNPVCNGIDDHHTPLESVNTANALEVFETSSDTITGDDGHISTAESPHVQTGVDCCCPSPVGTLVYDSSVTANQLLLLSGLSSNRQRLLGTKKMSDKCSSTSDISSSHVTNDNGPYPLLVDSYRCQQTGNCTAVGRLSVDTRMLPLMPTRNGHVTSNGDTDGSVSQTPSRSSTSPPTPNGDIKLGTWRTSCKPSHCVDWDGLPCYVDPVQQRIAQLVTDYEQQIQQLTSQLSQARNKYTVCMGQLNAESKDEQASNDSGDHGSMGGGSVGASDLSWEQVEEKDSQMTLWVPDHVVTHCAECQREFWMVRRKHHCRNCGHVFCAECSDYLLPVPQQHLDKPVRVCNRCYRQVLSMSAISDANTAVTFSNIENTSCRPAACGSLYPM